MRVGDVSWIARCQICKSYSSCSCSSCLQSFFGKICSHCKNTGIEPIPLSEIYKISEEVLDNMWFKYD